MTILTVLLVAAAACLVGAGIGLYTPDKSRTGLEAKYGVSPADYVTAAGLRLHVRDTGPKDAPAVIMLHGLGSSLLTWEPWAQALSATHRVIRFDLPGFGLTGADPTGDYSDARSVQVVVALMDAMAVPRASLIGNSLGGKIAWMLAAAHPERVNKLVLVSPDGFASPGFEYDKKPDLPAIAKLLPYILPTWMLRMNVAAAYGDPARLTADVVGRYRDMMLAPGVRRAMLVRVAQVRLEPPEPFLLRIEMPTLLLWGEKDALIPFSNAQDYLKVMRDCRLVSFPDLGHVPQEEAPARSLAPVAAFLDQH
jgi:pimeloyl-ACP methyl ester carboxylesterase